MIKRLLAAVLLFVVFAAFETAFIHALPDPWRYLPLVVALGVYLVQYLGSRTGALWIVAYGAVLDVSRSGNAPFETLVYGAAALASLYFSKRLFTNRSVYGVLACALIVFAAIAGLESLSLVWEASITGSAVGWSPYATMLAWQVAFLFIAVGILFYSARRAVGFFQSAFIIAKR